MTGYTAIHEAAAMLDLAGRGKIRVSGEDRARLLHAMTTNHVQQLKPGESCYAFFLTAQGRILADVTIMAFEDHLLLDTEPETRAAIFQHLDKYIIADDVTLEDVSESVVTIALEGPLAGETLAALGATIPETAGGTSAWGSRIVFNPGARFTATGAPGYWIFAPASEKAELLTSGPVAATAAEIHTVRVENAKPRYSEDITEAYLPQETRRMEAVHFTKGCYLGQEIVERVRSRGQVHRGLYALEIDGQEPPAPGSKIMDGEKEAGVITSSAYSPARLKTAALGYVRAAHLNAALSVNGLAARTAY